MRRREVIAGISVAGIAGPLRLRAQPTGKPIFGILLVFSREGGRTFTDPIRGYLEALGFVDGRNIELDFRHADGNVDRLAMIATELVARRPAVIATFGDATGLAAQKATTSVPIVAMSEDLVRAKLVTNMRHPGANTTGLSVMGTELDAKRLELLAEMVQSRGTILLLANATAQALGLTLEEATITAPGDLDRAIREASARGMVGVNVLSSAFLFALRARIVGLTRELRMPAIYQWPEIADEGGLMAYGPSLLGAFRQVTTLVAKILKGAKPGELPVEQPTRFALHLNLGAAKELGLEVPASLLARVDKAIE